jgi:hypothetical protein
MSSLIKRISIGLTICGLGVVFALPPGMAAADDQHWLDKPRTNWNSPGMDIPAPPPADQDQLPTCGTQARSVETDYDQALSDAGWTVYGSYQAGWGVAIVSGLAGYDGMCRPMGFQDFVFVDGVFAGTLSPEPMDSRTDGARDMLSLLTADRVRSVFLRYKAGDPACCPSSKSSVLYGVDRSGSAPVVVPQSE